MSGSGAGSPEVNEVAGIDGEQSRRFDSLHLLAVVAVLNGGRFSGYIAGS